MAPVWKKNAAPMIGIAMVLALCAAAAAQVTIDPVVTSIGSTRDPVPGRDAPFVFRGESNVQLPAMNDSHDVVFRARSASEFDNNAGIAWGIYVKRPGDPLAVLVDTTVDAGTPGFPVPGRPAGARFLDFKAPLMNNNGDVVFHATFNDPIGGTRTGIYATHVSGGPLVKIVDTFDTVPGAGAATYSTFIFSSVLLQDLTPAALNDSGDLAFWAMFDGNSTSGLFGSSVSGGTVVQLADRTITPSGVPFGTPQPFLEIRPTMAINASGQVAFHGSIRINSPTGPIRNGVFRVPVAGGTPPVTVAFQFQTAPDAGTATFSNFSEEDIDDSGRVVFISGLSDATSGFYSADTPGGPFTRLVDTRAGGPDVPGDIAAAEFDALLIGAINEAGQSGFWARIRNSATANNQGIYRAEVGVTTIGFVQDAAATAPGLSAPARLTQFADLGAAINEDANLLFAGTGVDELGAGMRGLYFYDACADSVARIVDSTISAAELGGTFSTLGTQSKKLSAYQGGYAVSGRFQALSEDNQVAFLAQFDNFDFGIYVATITSSGGSGGGIEITCPASVSLECPADTSPAALGEATAVDSCSGASVATSFADVTSTGCGTTGTITRTWSADDGFGNIVSCEQVIEVADTLSPALVGVPANTSAECDDVPAAAAVTATDDCDASPAVSLAESTAAGDCPNDYTLTRTWTATDACGNSAMADQSIEVSDTTAPQVTCPPDQLGLACNSDTSSASTGEATGSDNCGTVSISSSDDTTPGCGDTVSIARTWTASDECDNDATCVQAISTVDNTPPVLNVDTTPIVASDADCSGAEVVALPTATATDDCGDATVSNDAPASFPAGATTTVTFTAEDECGNTTDASVDVTVENSTKILIDAQRFVVGLGSHPGVTHEPIEDIEVCAYQRGSGSCALAACGILHAVLFQCILDNCPPVACATTDANGYAEIPVPPGKYVVIASDETFLILPSPLGGLVEDLDCGDTELVRLRQLSLPNGKKLSTKIARLLGSELLIIEPEEILWDGTEQLYPFVFESVGDWDVTVAVAPPDGFVADHDALSTTVQSDEKAVQFVITEVGSDLVPTQTTFNVMHNGRKRVVRSQVGIKLTAEYAKSRGFDVAELRQKGLIKEHPVPVAADVEVKPVEVKPQAGAATRK